MYSRIRLLTVAALALGLSTAFSQPPPSRPSKSEPIPPAAPGSMPKRAQQEKSLEQILDELESLRDQKADIEKKEAELIRVIQRKVEKQSDRMTRLGIGSSILPQSPATERVPVVRVADRIGRILIEGNPDNDEKKILDLVKLTPGHELNYPSLEEARVKLAKAGYKSATVAVRPGETAAFKDVVIKIGETEQK